MLRCAMLLSLLVACKPEPQPEKKVEPVTQTPALPAPAPAPDRPERAAEPRVEGQPSTTPEQREAIEAERRAVATERKVNNQAIESITAELGYLERRITSTEREVAAATTAEARDDAMSTLTKLMAQRAELRARRDALSGR